jgi:acetyl-CoA carboxylase biotin carboxyl carrier protein
MGIDEILTLIEAVQNTDIHELEVSNGDWKVRISRLTPSAAPAVSNGASLDPPAVSIPPVSAPEPPAEAARHEEQQGYIELTSPIVGTFYRAPEPGAEPFVKENDIVVPGQTMCIIEAMKLMNDIPSEIKARIVKILVENAQPVEYGQPLFLLEPV